MHIRRLLAGLCLAAVFSASFAQRSFDVDIIADTFGFDKDTPRSVNFEDLRQGCPARDCIPAIDKPDYVAADAASHVSDDDLVITLAYNGKYWAFPSKILDRHEIVNDSFGGDPLAVTWCPLCGSAVGIKRTVRGTVTTFGVSGLREKRRS